MDDSYGLLVELFADLCAAFWPIRHHMTTGGTATAQWEIQQAYPAEGLPWASDKATEAGRKWSQRNLEWLADERLVTTIRAAGRSIGVRFTERGLQTAAALAGEPSADIGFVMLQELLDLRAQGHDANYLDVFRGKVPEELLAEAEWGGPTKPFLVTQTLCLPAIVRGWITTDSSVLGHLWYTATPEGEDAAASPLNGQLLPALPASEAEAECIYKDRWVLARNRLASLEPKDSNEISPLPVPVSYAKGRTNATP